MGHLPQLATVSLGPLTMAALSDKKVRIHNDSNVILCNDPRSPNRPVSGREFQNHHRVRLVFQVDFSEAILNNTIRQELSSDTTYHSLKI